MDSVLIVSNSSGTMGIISDLLRSESFGKITISQNASEARRYISELDFDLIIIDTPLPDEKGDELSMTAAEKSTAGIILIVEAEDVYEIAATVEDYGVFAVPKPVSPEFFYQAVKLLNASRKRVQFLENENQKLQKKIEEIRLVDRAKLILIQVLKMTEPQAQRYIEKQSMDLRQTRLVTAENILRTYEH
ncbi:ANTAR domain-containing response regulator [Treponema sp.]|uniref:ANTAR domain-containing response regulator n=1 Tax=Treponema sp. TaxID=166 RepID=UPI0025FCFD3A|nr:ANTAR domain-containing protein [Treponema sp.]MCR5218731.1 ANTAR domain-containing protein [Treponema sp.]